MEILLGIVDQGGWTQKQTVCVFQGAGQFLCVIQWINCNCSSILQLQKLLFQALNCQTAINMLRHVGSGNEPMEKIDHAEADTKIVAHIQHALTEGATNVLVRIVDSDVVVILINSLQLIYWRDTRKVLEKRQTEGWSALDKWGSWTSWKPGLL